jgi:hypothetical protein
MKKSILKLIVIQVIIGTLLLLTSSPFQSCKKPVEPPACDTCIRALKPNIYLYPTEKSQLNVSLSFPLGGRIVTSIPNYNSGWRVVVDPSGMINDKYQLLFYESEQPDVWQLERGWIIKKSDLKTFFSDNMAKYGFQGREINDFLDYWIPRLTKSEFYKIFPQESDIIQTVIKLDVSRTPDNILRLFYVIKESDTDSDTKISLPINTVPFRRNGFCVTEWGVILK